MVQAGSRHPGLSLGLQPLSHWTASSSFTIQPPSTIPSSMKSSRLPSPGQTVAVPLLVPPPWQLAHLASVLTGSAPGTAPSPCGMEPACLPELSGQAPDAEVGVTGQRSRGDGQIFPIGIPGQQHWRPVPHGTGRPPGALLRPVQEGGRGCRGSEGPPGLPPELSLGGGPAFHRFPETPLHSLASQGSPSAGRLEHERALQAGRRGQASKEGPSAPSSSQGTSSWAPAPGHQLLGSSRILHLCCLIPRLPLSGPLFSLWM